MDGLKEKTLEKGINLNSKLVDFIFIPGPGRRITLLVKDGSGVVVAVILFSYFCRRLVSSFLWSPSIPFYVVIHPSSRTSKIEKEDSRNQN